MGGRPDPLLGSGLTGERSDPTADNACCGDLTASGFTGDVAVFVSPLLVHESEIRLERQARLCRALAVGN